MFGLANLHLTLSFHNGMVKNRYSSLLFNSVNQSCIQVTLGFHQGLDCILSQLEYAYTHMCSPSIKEKALRRPIPVQSVTPHHWLGITPLGGRHADFPIPMIFTVQVFLLGPCHVSMSSWYIGLSGGPRNKGFRRTSSY